MKIFLSYPHDDNAPLVERLKADLAKRHEVWIDVDKIKEGDEWRSKITRGILSSDAIVAFLSKHAVREPGVCLNEIAIALAEMGDDALFTVLVEPEDKAKVPDWIMSIQLIHMNDSDTEKDYEGWYKTKLDKLVELIEKSSSDERKEELAQLRSFLNPLSFNADISRHLPNFTGRRWLLEKHKQWLESDLNSRVFRIEGGPGLGKTAIASRLAHTIKCSVVAIFLCQYNSSESRNPLRFIQTLAYQLSTRLPDYRARLLQKLSNNPSLDIQANSPADLWATIIAEPLHRLNDRQRLTILIDGLDEATELGQNEIVKLLAEHIDKLPHWLTVTLTGRPDPELVKRLSKYKPHTINGDEANNQADLEAYIAHWLQKEVSANRISTTQADKAKKAMLEKSEGAFLYLVKAREAYEAGYLDLTQPSSLPEGLNEIYSRFFERRFADTSANSDWELRASRLLRFILLNPEPLPLNIARELMGWDIADDGNMQQVKTLRSLGSLIEQRDTQFGIVLSLFHNSAREWLQNGQLADQYFIDFRLSYLIKLCTLIWANFIKDHDHYGWLILPEILPLLKEKSESSLNNLLGELTEANVSELFNLADGLSPRCRFREAFAMFHISATYLELLSKINPKNTKYLYNLKVCYERLADTARNLGDSKALNYYMKGQQILKDLTTTEPDNKDYLHSMSINFLKIGELYREFLNNRESATFHFQKGNKILEDLHRLDSTNSAYVNDLCMGYENMGKIELELGGDEVAYPFFQKAFEFRFSLCKAFPDNTDYLSNLSTSYENLGKLKRTLGKDIEARLCFLNALDIRIALSKNAPENADYLNNLSVSYENLGVIEHHLAPYSLAAQSAFNQAFIIREHLHQTAPENIKWASNLSVSYDWKGEFESDPKVARSNFDSALKIREDLYKAYPENVMNAYSLNISYKKLGDLCYKLRDFDNARPLYLRAYDICKDLKNADSENLTYIRELSVSLNCLGDLNCNDNPIAAQKNYLEAVELHIYLITKRPNNALYAREIAFIYAKLSMVSVNGEQKKWLLKCIQQLEKMKLKEGFINSDEELLKRAKEQFKKC